MIKFITDNPMLIFIVFIVVVVAVLAAILFLMLPTDAQVSAMEEWLKYAVTKAEKELGSGTGQLKLRMVYELFVEKFTWLARWITFDTFSGYVDDALAWLKEQLSSNQAVATLVIGKSYAAATIGFDTATGATAAVDDAAEGIETVESNTESEDD